MKTVAGCQDCHTPSDDKGQPLPGLDFGGGFLLHDPADHMKPIFTLNITHDPSGIAHYDEALFVQTFKTGLIGSHRINPIMPILNFRGMEEGDLRDMYAYLAALPPVKHRITNTDPPAKCAVCGQVHGLGELNAAKAK